MSKKVFAEGALRAAAYIIQKNKGYFDMNNLIDEN
jgi:dihydrodipicolinate reductase